jgi:diaminohydroxyphosphoribosylaminopyrimidine deaminase/5-amino-6-(5-phosphoribosylamino)uracil reductase
MSIDELYMRRCIELAKLAAGHVGPNPMVGSVLVAQGVIIGEGYHQQYGKAHAEVNCINNVSAENRPFIQQSTLYVSLEPCMHFGKTPPCADLIIANKIPRVVIGCQDPFKQVDGKGIEKLKQAGIEVSTNVLEEECRELNKRFFTFHTQQRPYIILKWAESLNNKIGSNNGERVLISNEFTNRKVHKWRGQESAILVGTNTALLDNPSLNTRYWPGKNPMRLIVDMDLRLPPSLQVFDQAQRTIVFNSVKHEEDRNILYYQINVDVSLVHQLLNACLQSNIQSILVEGGAMLLQTLIDEEMWDEARVIQNNELIIHDGLPAPILKQHALSNTENILTDTISYYKPIIKINNDSASTTWPRN